MDTEKAVDRILRIARRLTDEGYAFHWYFVGDGVLLREWTALRDQLALQKTVTFLGRMENPYPVMKAAEQAGFSEYSTFLRAFRGTFHMSPREFR